MSGTTTLNLWRDHRDDYQQFVPSTFGTSGTRAPDDYNSTVVVSEARFQDEFSSLQETEELESQIHSFADDDDGEDYGRRRHRHRNSAQQYRWWKSPLCLLGTALVFLLVCIIVSTTIPHRAIAWNSPSDNNNNPTSGTPTGPSSPLDPENDDNTPPAFETSGSWAQAVQISVGDGIQEIGYVQDTAIHGNTLVASALDTNRRGTAYVFQAIGATQWFPQGLLIPIDQQDPQPTNAFGMCVSIYDNMAIVGDSKTTVQGVANAGTIYVFTRNAKGQWKEQTRLHPTTHSQPDTFFGSSCALDGTTLVVGAPTATGMGSAYVFEYNSTLTSWTQTAQLTPDETTFDCDDKSNAFRLGSYVSYYSGTAVLSPSSSGTCRRVYVFERQSDDWTSWQQTNQLGQDGMCDYRVAVGESYLAVGDPCQMVDDVPGAGQVTIYQKDQGGWNTTIATLSPSEKHNNDNFGRDVAVEGNSVLISQPGDSRRVGGAVLYTMSHHQHHENKFELVATLATGFYGGTSIALMGDEYAIVTSSLSKNYAVQEDSVHVFAKKQVLGVDGRTPSTPAAPPAVVSTNPSFAALEWKSRPPVTLQDATNSTRFGNRVAVHQGTVMASTMNDNVHVYSWTEESGWTGRNITPENVQSDSLFGSCLGIDGDWAISGASRHDGQSGRLYIFHKNEQNEWTLHSTLQAQDSTTRDRFGWDCDISGNTIAVSAPTADTDDHTNLGTVFIYVYDGSTWTLTTRISPSLQGGCSGEMNDYRFGSVLSLDGSTLAVAPDPAGSCRRVYVFERFGTLWPQISELGENGDCTYDVTLDRGGTVMAVGDSCYSDGSVNNMGRVQLYTKNQSQQWVLQDTIQDDFPEENAGLGAAVSLDGDKILIGRPGVSPDNGGAYFYTRSNKYGWENQQFLESGRNSGSQIALVGNTAVIGSPYDGDQNGAENTGSVRVYVYSTE
jgi:hypothetical protein